MIALQNPDTASSMFVQLSWEVTKQPCLSQLVRMITGHCMHQLETSTTIYSEPMEMALSLWGFLLIQKVSVSFISFQVN